MLAARLRSRHQSTGATFVLYLTAGQVVAPGYFLNSAANITGPATYFDGTLLSY
ncbi:hypothetical protein KP696_10535 [Nocardia seriolae]|uniref:Uncharacterized protein n=1 Tax=Nocardia seriolae TaxID=37332 RepID=A0ABC9Z0V3_9NOCA|nr:conserved hypothetical protein [Nocardia seriolae]GEM27015.1 hypothetical protein NS2_52540 [Nocardia seriolae NBRC 15557]BEK85096.1 hypothetical protein NSERKGN1266_10470 [Nocardia seriolae]BEK99062.1 hypothetical protein NSER024013_69680 [Nocardia seriolae]GAM49373.1 hypothetical protein NS07_v2contig00106-0007 [Nocardia seriolae]